MNPSHPLRDSRLEKALQRLLNDCASHAITARVHFYTYARSERISITMQSPMGFLFNCNKEIWWSSNRKVHMAEDLLTQARAVYNAGLYPTRKQQERLEEAEARKVESSGEEGYTMRPDPSLFLPDHH